MRLYVGIRLWLSLFSLLLPQLLLLLLSLLRSLLSLLSSVLLLFNQNFSLGKLLLFSFIFGILFEGLEFLLGLCRGFCVEVVEPLLLCALSLVGLLLFDHGAHFGFLGHRVIVAETVSGRKSFARCSWLDSSLVAESCSRVCCV